MSQLADGETTLFLSLSLGMWFSVPPSLPASSSTPGPSQMHVYVSVCLWINTHQSTHRHIYTDTFIQYDIPSLYFVLHIEVKKDGCSDRGAVSVWRVHACKPLFVHSCDEQSWIQVELTGEIRTMFCLRKEWMERLKVSKKPQEV